ncbi:hypothetical protein [Zwartia vadi]|uniref:hypothetical protein n=1 Tax=Zwartia vadi TaxID=3058168 RepID=UPI0025B559F9|nr:hypothetical protein [Zwartia vadi]MDN3988659.1 hypothetical protein [Zwartia vadi]
MQSLNLLQPSNLRHSFQAPTLIGCQIFKEQGTAEFYKPSFLLLAMLFGFDYVPEAEKRDYEGVFYPCQTCFNQFAKNFENNFAINLNGPTQSK